MISAIETRRSIRCFLDKPIPREILEEVLLAGTLAPSSKNRQPWRFIVTAGEEKAKILDTMEKGLERERTAPLLPESAAYLSGAVHTLSVMRQAPVNVFMVNPLGENSSQSLTPEWRIYEICNAQFLGAAVQIICLAAELCLGTLWICDTFFAYDELMESLGTEGALFAALALGWPDESPDPRPRKPLAEVTEWRCG